MGISASERRRMHAFIGDGLAAIHERLQGMPKATAIFRDPDVPGRYVIVGNEDDAVCEALKRAIGADDSGETVDSPTDSTLSNPAPGERGEADE